MRVFYGLRSKETKSMIGIVRIESDRDGFGGGYRLNVVGACEETRFLFAENKDWLRTILSEDVSLSDSRFDLPSLGLIDPLKLEIYEVDLNPDSLFVGRSRKHGIPKE